MVSRSRIPATDALTDEQRLSRIFDLLAKAVVLEAAGRVVSPPPAPVESRTERESPAEILAQSGADTRRIESYIALVGEASPAMMRETLGLSRMRVFRATQRLLSARKIETHGQTRTTVYRLSQAQAANFGRN